MGIFGKKAASEFSSSSTAAEVVQGIDGSGLTAIVTGATSGIGTETARVLASRGVNVTIGVRNVKNGEKVKETITKEFPEAKVSVLELDLASLESVSKFASEYNSCDLPLNLLINNAGVMATPYKLSQDNVELQFATNHLGHFLLTNLLLENMKNTARESGIQGRIVNVSSEGHRFAYKKDINFDKISDKSGYCTMYAYGVSKLANILHVKELTRRFKEEEVNITANSLHPGLVDTNLLAHRSFINGLMGSIAKYFVKNVHQGAATTCYLALHPQVEGESGEYFSDCKKARPSKVCEDEGLAQKLWEFSLKLTETKN